MSGTTVSAATGASLATDRRTARPIDLSNVTYRSTGSATLLAGNTLQVIEGSTTSDLKLDPSKTCTGEDFHAAPGTSITVNDQPLCGSPAESYRNDGHRWLFQNASHWVGAVARAALRAGGNGWTGGGRSLAATPRALGLRDGTAAYQRSWFWTGIAWMAAAGQANSPCSAWTGRPGRCRLPHAPDRPRSWGSRGIRDAWAWVCGG
jgi:hypothetical protein